MERIYGSLRKSQRSFNQAQSTYDGLVEKERNVSSELENIPQGHPSRRAKSDELLQLRAQKEHSQTTMDAHSKKLDSLNRQLIEAGLKTPPESSDSEDDAFPSDASSEAEMQTEETEGAQDEEDEEEAEGETSPPMDDGGAKVTAASESTGINREGVEEEDDGDVTKVENCLLDTPPPSNPELMAPDSMDPTNLECQTLPVEDRQA